MSLGNIIGAVIGGTFGLAALLVLVAVLLWQASHPLKPPEKAPKDRP
jgi:hypothetical protein